MNQPCRYILVPSHRSLWRTIVIACRSGVWSRTEQHFEPVLPGDPRYGTAPYEAIVIQPRLPRTDLDELSPTP